MSKHDDALDQIARGGHLYDGCPTCDAIKAGDHDAARESMFRQPDAGEHRVVWWGTGERTYLTLLAHGDEWTSDVSEVQVLEHEACPVCQAAVPTYAEVAPW